MRSAWRRDERGAAGAVRAGPPGLIRSAGDSTRNPLLDDADPALSPKLTDEQLELLAKHGHVRATEVDEVLFREGDTTYDVMVLLEGEVAVLVGSAERMRKLAIQRPRDLMAELNILTGQRVHATGVVREAGSVLVTHYITFVILWRHWPERV